MSAIPTTLMRTPLASGGSFFPAAIDELFRVVENGSQAKKPFLLNVREIDGLYELKARLVGVKREDVDLTVEDGALIVAVQAPEEDTEGYAFREWSVASGTRRLNLPQDADPESVSASFNDGVLTVTIGKLAEKQPKKIAIS